MDFSLPAGNSSRRRRLKKPGAPAPGFTGVWGRSVTNKRATGIYRGIACHYLNHTTRKILDFPSGVLLFIHQFIVFQRQTGQLL